MKAPEPYRSQGVFRTLSSLPIAAFKVSEQRTKALAEVVISSSDSQQRFELRPQSLALLLLLQQSANFCLKLFILAFELLSVVLVALEVVLQLFN